MRTLDAHSKNEAMEKPEAVLSRLSDGQGITPIHRLDELSDLWPADDDPDALISFVLR
jgi:hypothetical protein